MRPDAVRAAEGVRDAGWWHVAAATLRRDVLMARSYPVGFILGLASSALGVLSILFLDAAFGESAAGSLGAYGGSYFGFAVIGVALSTFMAAGLSGMASRVREGQLTGTLELLLVSPNPLPLLLFSSALWVHARALLTLALYFVIAIPLGMDMSRANWPIAIVSLVIAVVAFNALGLIASAYVIVLKQGNPVTLVLTAASSLLAGVLYPVAVLPEWLQAIAGLLPLTHALELARRAILVGEEVDALIAPLASLLILAVVLLVVGAWTVDRAVRIAKTDGSLSQY